MKKLELDKKNKAELNKLLRERRERLRRLRFDLIADKLKNHRQIRRTKREIARISTVLNSRVKN